MTARCPLCESQFATISIFMTHLKLIHSNEPNFNMQCNLQGCQRTFKNFYTYRNHVYSIHSQESVNPDPLCEDLETRSSHIRDSLETDSTTENDHGRNSPILEVEPENNQLTIHVKLLYLATANETAN